ncbi:MAG: S9 family peptidase [Sulfobacillus benefaciens]|uniref:S9 family peptidase n=1 Tax=Sulfobacillus benefaciens TaxID=453960 RepID=A0A2T2XI90_9FIRM|nr:MAG: S9 family peptidase [Sulfobacillus benefaciens]
MLIVMEYSTDEGAMEVTDKSSEHLTPEMVASLPLPGTTIPQKIRFSPDGKCVLYLLGDTENLALSLWKYDIAMDYHEKIAGPQSGSAWNLDEELRRERTRMIWEGITDYQVAECRGRQVILIPQGDKLFVLKGANSPQELAGVLSAQNPLLLTDGRVVYVKQGELWRTDIDGSSPIQLTHGGAPEVTRGIAEYAAQEELGRTTGFWVSAQGTWLAFEEVDDRHVPEFPLVHWERDLAMVEPHRYPFVGEPNAKTRLGLVSMDGGPIRWLDFGEEEQYIARVIWRNDRELAVMLLSRDNKRLRWVLYDVLKNVYAPLFEERSPLWVNVGDDTRFLDTGEILTSSEASGFRHLWIYDQDTPGGRQITHGEYEVQRLLAVDEPHRLAYVAATKETPLEVHIYRVGLDDGQMTRLSNEPGVHHAVISPDFNLWVDQSGSLQYSPQTRLMTMTGDIEAILHGENRLTPENLGLKAPELVTVAADDGITLYGAVYPAKTDVRPVPAIVNVYGGTHAQMVLNSWNLTIDLQAQLLSQKGYLVFKLDNRGSYHRGKQFEGYVYRRFATVEVQDQVTGVHWLVENRHVDPHRIGIYGWSYGGYMSLMALLKAPDIFRVAVAGAPVTDFRFYDTAYTERYMETPQNNPQGYHEASVLSYVDQLQGDLLIIHGLLDENVHFRNSVRLIQALNQVGKSADLVLLPESRHAVRGFHNVLTVIRRRTEYFLNHL